MEFIFANLPNMIKDEEDVEQTDIVLWTNSAVHHEPRHEDGKPDSGPRLWPGDDAWEGSALLMWSGFDLRPRNLFDRTPFYPYSPAPPARPGASATPSADPQDRTGQATAPAATSVPSRRLNTQPTAQAKPYRQPAEEHGDADILRQRHAAQDGRLIAPNRFERPARQRDRRSSARPSPRRAARRKGKYASSKPSSRTPPVMHRSVWDAPAAN